MTNATCALDDLVFELCGRDAPAAVCRGAGRSVWREGLEVKFVAAAKAPDFSLSGFAARVKAVAPGHADFALTSVAYLLAVQTEAAGCLPVRFIATAHQRNPTVGVVREDSGLRVPQDLPGTRAARWSMPWFTQEYAGARDNWALFEPYAFDGGTPGAMHADRWQTTTEHTATTHRLSPCPAERVYRPEMLAPAVEYAAAQV